MDWLKIFLSLYMMLLILGLGSTVYMVNKPREPVSPATGCGLVIWGMFTLIMLLLIWQRL
jgi:succinate-acetate transporter protein